VAAVREDCLSCHPPAISRKERDDGYDIGDVRERSWRESAQGRGTRTSKWDRESKTTPDLSSGLGERRVIEFWEEYALLGTDPHLRFSLSQTALINEWGAAFRNCVQLVGQPESICSRRRL
jgi:hypothetical protein